MVGTVWSCTYGLSCTSAMGVAACEGRWGRENCGHWHGALLSVTLSMQSPLRDSMG